MVGVVGFELTTPWTQTKCASQTALHPDTVKAKQETIEPASFAALI